MIWQFKQIFHLKNKFNFLLYFFLRLKLLLCKFPIIEKLENGTHYPTRKKNIEMEIRKNNNKNT